jgi:hypothetical protein
MYYGLDPLYYALTIPAVLLALWAQMKVSMAYSKYSRMRNARGISGAQAAKELLDAAGVYDVDVTMTEGWLSDHYDPTSRTLRLSAQVYSGDSVAAIGVAAHEAGHALQHAHGYALMGLRNFIVPAASIGSYLSWPLIVIGFMLSSLALVKAGVLFFSGVVVFQLVTLPVEFNASSRAKALLSAQGIVTTEEEALGVERMLSAAAMTYVAATIGALLQLLYFLLRMGALGRRDD